MADWFAPKRFGYGARLPISWQGWAITLAFIALTIAVAVLFARRPLILFAILVPLLATFMTIAARTTRGGWGWRWGRED